MTGSATERQLRSFEQQVERHDSLARAAEQAATAAGAPRPRPADAVVALEEARAAESEIAAALAEAGERVIAAEAATGEARAGLSAAQHAEMAHVLRGRLTAGDPCPVCAQPVATMPRRGAAPKAVDRRHEDAPAGRDRRAAGAIRPGRRRRRRGERSGIRIGGRTAEGRCGRLDSRRPRHRPATPRRSSPRCRTCWPSSWARVSLGHSSKPGRKSSRRRSRPRRRPALDSRPPAGHPTSRASAPSTPPPHWSSSAAGSPRPGGRSVPHGRRAPILWPSARPTSMLRASCWTGTPPPPRRGTLQPVTRPRAPTRSRLCSRASDSARRTTSPRPAASVTAGAR